MFCWKQKFKIIELNLLLHIAYWYILLIIKSYSKKIISLFALRGIWIIPSIVTIVSIITWYEYPNKKGNVKLVGEL